MSKKISIAIILLISLFTLSGCSMSNNNIEDYYYVVAIGIDKSKESNGLSVSVQIAMTSDDSSSDSSQSTASAIYTAEAPSINSAISIFDNYLSKKLNFSHCSAVIFSEDIAKSGINSYITTLANNSEIRPTCKIIVTNSSSAKALEAVSNSDENFSAKLYEFIIDSADYTGYSINPEILDFLYNINSNTKCGVVTYASISDDIFEDIGMAVFSEDKFVTNLGVLESISYSLITDNLKNSSITIDDPFFSGEVLDITISPKEETSINVDLINGYPYIQISSKLNCSINSMNAYFDYESAENVAILEEAINSYIEKICLDFLYKIYNEYGLDICDFQNNLSSKYSTLDEFQKINWNKICKSSCFNVDINSSIEYSRIIKQRVSIKYREYIK